MNPTDDKLLRLEDMGIRSILTKIGPLFILFSFIFLLAYLGSALPWWLLIVLALPVCLASEKFGAALFSDKRGWSTRQVGFSPVRILIGVGFVLLVSISAYFLFR